MVSSTSVMLLRHWVYLRMKVGGAKASQDQHETLLCVTPCPGLTRFFWSLSAALWKQPHQHSRDSVSFSSLALTIALKIPDLFQNVAEQDQALMSYGAFNAVLWFNTGCQYITKNCLLGSKISQNTSFFESYSIIEFGQDSADKVSLKIKAQCFTVIYQFHYPFHTRTVSLL